MEQYRRLIEWSVLTLRDPSDFIRTHERRMQQAAAELKFESAGRIKQYVDSLSVLGKGPYRHLRRLRDFRYISLQRGPTARSAKVFLITPANVTHIASLIEAPTPASPASGLTGLALSIAEETAGTAIAPSAAERLGLVSHHLFSSKSGGVFIPLDKLDDRSLAAGYRELCKQKISEPGDEEGIMKELAAI